MSKAPGYLPPPPWAAQMAADLVPDQPRAHEGHSFTLVPAEPWWRDRNAPGCDMRNAGITREMAEAVRAQHAFAALSRCFASLSLIGDAVEWQRRMAGPRTTPPTWCTHAGTVRVVTAANGNSACTECGFTLPSKEFPCP